MPLEERRARWVALMEALRRKDLASWSDSFLDALAAPGRAAA
jgi:trehalose-6-phosphate synthase